MTDTEDRDRIAQAVRPVLARSALIADVDWLVQQVERLTDVVAEFRKREESQDRIRERLTAENQALQARLDAVTALLDQWEREAGPDSNAWAVYGPQKLSTPFAVNQLRAALKGDPDE